MPQYISWRCWSFCHCGQCHLLWRIISFLAHYPHSHNKFYIGQIAEQWILSKTDYNMTLPEKVINWTWMLIVSLHEVYIALFGCFYLEKIRTMFLPVMSYDLILTYHSLTSSCCEEASILLCIFWLFFLMYFKLIIFSVWLSSWNFKLNILKTKVYLHLLVNILKFLWKFLFMCHMLISGILAFLIFAIT